MLFPWIVSGQTNTDFWFAAPEASVEHGDSPIYLRVTSFSEAATVTISEPANTANFPTQVLYIPANQTRTLNLTTWKDQVECKPANAILNFGLYLHSTVPITAYYEVTNIHNAEIFTLKGNNAMGTSFFIPSQSSMYNHSPLVPQAYNSFDIVATEYNTTVTITPRRTIVGHAAGVAFTVNLNRGQVYSAQATGLLGIDHLQGSTVTSNKPVSITVKDDSDQYPNQVCYDLTGDQIVPVNIIGQEYIVVRGFTNNTMNDWAYVTATANATNVSVNGTVQAILNAGETYKYSLQNFDLSSFISTTHPVYVWHVTGYGCEAGSAILPPMNCTGSTQVAFTRTTQYSFELILLAKAGAQGSFTLDGNPTLVTAAMFSSVIGNPAFVYARIEFPVDLLPVGFHILKNSQDIFHMGVIHTYDQGQSGCSYGYFSDFASLNLGPDKSICPGTFTTLDAGPNRQSYEWYYNGSPFSTGVQTITVNNPGQYIVIVNDHGCFLSDTVQLDNYPAPVPVISGITSFCQGFSQLLTVTGTFSSYLWTTGENTQTITVSGSGTYGVTVTDMNGCQGSTFANVIVFPLPLVTLTLPAVSCTNVAPFALTGGSPAGGVYSGPGVNSITGFFDPGTGTGTYLISYTYTDANGCNNKADQLLTVSPPPVVQLLAQSVCISVPPFPLTGGTPPGGVYSGTGVNSSTGYFDPSSGAGPHNITYTYTDANGCTGTAVNILTVNPLPLVQLSPQPPVCVSAPPFQLTGGTPPGGTYSGFGVNSSTGFFSPSSGVGPHTITYMVTNTFGCFNSTFQILIVNPLPLVVLSAQSSACANAPPFLLTGGTPAGGIYSGPGVNSLTGFFDPASGTGTHTITYTYTDGSGCTNSDSKPLLVNSAPVVQLSNLAPVCITVAPFALSGGSPAPGTYSGPGVNTATGFFNPQVAGPGDHVIVYAFTSTSGCTNTASKTLHVIPLPLPSGTLNGPDTVCQGTQNISYTLNGADPLATSFTWEISPASAGSVNGTTSACLVSLNTGYSGSLGIRFQPGSTCGNGAFSSFTTVTVNPGPDVWLDACNDPVTTKGSKPFVLKGGIPAGGIYSIDGTPLPGGILNPATLSPSPPDHSIKYSYTNRFNCTVTKTRSLTVKNASVFTCTNTLTDVRDMKTYPTFEIIAGSVHRCWMASNLNYGVVTPNNLAQTDNCVVEKYCQGNDPAKCTELGGLYQWDELMTYLPVENASAEGRQGLCPPEWHVATEAEWEELINYYEGPGVAGWNILDPNPLYGFHAKTPGILYQNLIWSFGQPWFTATIISTSTVSPSGSTRIYSHGLNVVNPSVSTYFSTRSYALSVRCVRD